MLHFLKNEMFSCDHDKDFIYITAANNSFYINLLDNLAYKYPNYKIENSSLHYTV